jgi:hypothetical protein
MSFDHLINRLTSPYNEGKRTEFLAKYISQGGTSYNEELLVSLAVGAPIIIIVETDIGDIGHSFDLQIKDGDYITKTVTSISIPAKTLNGSVIYIKLSDFTDTQTCREVIGLVSITSSGTEGEAFTIRSLSGNTSKLMGLNSVEFSEFVEFLHDDTANQRFLSKAEKYALDLHGQEVNVFRQSQDDDTFRGRIQLEKTFGFATEELMSNRLIEFAGLITPPSFLNWYASGWIINQSTLPDGCVLGALIGVGRLVTECRIIDSETTKTQDELQAFVDGLTPVGTYVAIKLV